MSLADVELLEAAASKNIECPLVIVRDAGTQRAIGAYMGYEIFRAIALSSKYTPEAATAAFQHTVVVLGRECVPPLPVALSKRKAVDVNGYLVSAPGFVESRSHLVGSSRYKHPEINGVFRGVMRYAEAEVYDWMRLCDDPQQLDDAFYCPINPTLPVENGLVVTYRDFVNAGHEVGCGAVKVSRLFDQLVAGFSNHPSVLRNLDMLTYYANPQSRRDIRSELYIKTQTLVDLLHTLEAMNLSERKRQGLNQGSLEVLRSILYDEKD